MVGPQRPSIAANYPLALIYFEPRTSLEELILSHRPESTRAPWPIRRGPHRPRISGTVSSTMSSRPRCHVESARMVVSRGLLGRANPCEQRVNVEKECGLVLPIQSLLHDARAQMLVGEHRIAIDDRLARDPDVVELVCCPGRPQVAETALAYRRFGQSVPDF